MKISEEFKDGGNIIKKAAARQIGDTKVDKNGVTLVWTQTPSGGQDWRIQKKGSTTKVVARSNDPAKVAAAVKNTPTDKLHQIALKPGNAARFRQMAYDELVERGEDVSGIDMNTGTIKDMNDAFGTDKDTTDYSGLGMDEDNSEEEIVDDWADPDLILKKFGGLKTKAQRIAYDEFVHAQKLANPNYKTPDKQIQQLNKLYARFLNSKTTLMVASGGAGVGKTHNFKLVAKVLNKKQFDPEMDTPGDADYDWVEAPTINSPIQLISFLKEHNGKVILFDDNDDVLKKTELANAMKLATATSGKRWIGKASGNSTSQVQSFEFTGQIVVLTNMSQSSMNKDDNARAVSSRAVKNDIYFTKKEQLFFIDKFKHTMELTGSERLPNKADDMAERDEVFQIMKDNIDEIDPNRFNARSLGEMIMVKRAEDDASEYIANDPVMGAMLFGEADDWRESVKNFLIKGVSSKKGSTLEKAKNVLGL